jgi:hypothetical protein
MNNSTNIFLFFFYFILSTVITWWFIIVAPMYISQEQMMLSCGIAGGKWMIQVAAGYLLLGDKRWEFLKRIGFTCFIGSVILLPYSISGSMHWNNSPRFFLGSLIVAVLAMILLYYNSVRKCRISLKWWLEWLVCLAIAISLQLTVVFHVL